MIRNHAEALRKAAEEIRAENHNGWGNTCEWAAEAIDASQAEIERIRKALRDITALLPNPTLPITHAVKDIADVALSGAAS